MVSTLDEVEHEYAVRMVKTSLMANITTHLTLKKVSQSEAADELDMTQPQISAIVCGDHARFSIGHLVRINRQLGYGVDLNFYQIDRSVD